MSEFACKKGYCLSVRLAKCRIRTIGHTLFFLRNLRNMSEIWKKIHNIGDSNHYFEVSNKGRMKSIRSLKSNDGLYRLTEKGHKVLISGESFAREIEFHNEWEPIGIPTYEVNRFGEIRKVVFLCLTFDRNYRNYSAKAYKYYRASYKNKHIKFSVRKLMKEYFPDETI